MSQREPTRWYVRYEATELYAQELARTNGDEDSINWADIKVEENATSHAHARLICRLRANAHRVHGATMQIMERRDIHYDADENEWAWTDKTVQVYDVDDDHFEAST